MSMGGGGGGGAPPTPASEIAAKEIESQRYDLAQGINAAHLPRYVAEARRDLSGTLSGLANADIMSRGGNTYIGANGNAFGASMASDALNNARNTAIIRARGSGESDRIARTDAALRSINGTAESAARGLLSQASRQSEEAMNSAMNRFNNRQSSIALATSILGSAAAIGLDKMGRKRATPAPVEDAKPTWVRGK
ncbi:hypothetical protein K7G91_000914 [Pasteurella canis]|uniref:hypothetical protein n=1 Tax=Pasteurella canis TaxID=753 RepID=UPI0006663F95|nr:hypothetical protein [Pasteurella canis]UDW84627.1 hypothetical protein K7G91_000914 [Pasteurella canis]